MSRKNKKLNLKQILIFIIATIILGIFQYFNGDFNYVNVDNTLSSNTISANLENIPEYSGNPYVQIDNNIPSFTENDYTTKTFETYSKLDNYGRCGVAYANICKEVMPAKDEERRAINSIIPSGWKQDKYEGIIDGNYLYNRCHLIGYQLAGENANKQNLITGTRYMNVEGMLPFENKIADYMEKKPNNHVLYRVTPVFDGDNLLASGVQLEAYSVEDKGKGVCFNVYVYNVQPGIDIDYATGESKLSK